MMKKLLLILPAMLAFGCSGSNDGDVEAAQKASAAAPKSVNDLPADMPEGAKASAGAAIQQGQAMQEQMSAQAAARSRAMEEMQKQRGR